MIYLLLCCWAMVAQAITPDELETKLRAMETYRHQRQADRPPSLSMQQMRRTANGSIVTGLVDAGDGTSKAYGAALLDVPISQMWSAALDETRAMKYTATAYAEILTGRPCQNGRRVLQMVEVPWVADRWWIGVPSANRTLLRNSGGSVREMTFNSSVNASEVTSVSGKTILGAAEPIAYSRGAWFMVAIDSRHTYVEYYVWSDPGGSIPSSLASSFATKGVTNNINAMRKFAKEGRPACPIE